MPDSILMPEDIPHPAITIDSHVPIPHNIGSRGGGRYGGTGLAVALRSLEVGQSFIAPNPRGMKLVRVQSDASQSIRRLRPKRFATRAVTEEGGVRVVRIWRVA